MNEQIKYNKNIENPIGPVENGMSPKENIFKSIPKGCTIDGNSSLYLQRIGIALYLKKNQSPIVYTKNDK